MTQIDAGGILDIAMAGTSATLLARIWESTPLVNVDNHTLRRVLDSPETMAAVERIEGWRALGDNVIETIINKSDKAKELKNKAKNGDLAAKEKKADVIANRLKEAEFAADLFAVDTGRAQSGYEQPIFFYAKTFVTEGLKRALTSASRRLAAVRSSGSRPVLAAAKRTRCSPSITWRSISLPGASRETCASMLPMEVPAPEGLH